MKILIAMLFIGLFIFTYMEIDMCLLKYDFKRKYPNRKSKVKPSFIVKACATLKLLLWCCIPIWNLILLIVTFSNAYRESVFKELLEDTREVA